MDTTQPVFPWIKIEIQKKILKKVSDSWANEPTLAAVFKIQLL